MNFNDRPMGFGSGDLNPARSSEERAKRSKRFINNNPNKNPESVAKRTKKLKGRPSPTKGKKYTEQQCQNISKGRTGIKISKERRQKLSQSRKQEYLDGTRILPTFRGGHHSQETKDRMSKEALEREKITCTNCGRIIDKGNYMRWHGNNCKTK